MSYLTSNKELNQGTYKSFFFIMLLINTITNSKTENALQLEQLDINFTQIIIHLCIFVCNNMILFTYIYYR